jgi:hypothetical protein
MTAVPARPPDDAPTASARDGLDLLRGFLIAGLVITTGTGQGVMQDAFRGALPLLAGLAFGVALAEERRTGRVVSPRHWTLHLFALWLATFSPALWGDREMLRTCAVAGALVIAWRGGGRARTGALVTWGIVAGAALAAPSSYWLRVATGEVFYGLGGAWPRGWTDIALDASLFLAGSRAAGTSILFTVAGWGGVTDPFRALGRMPLTALAMQYILSPAAIGAHVLLVGQLALAVLWLRKHRRGPCEQVVHGTYATIWRVGSWVRPALHR